MIKLIQFGALLLVVLYLISASLLYVFQRDLLYIESPEYQHTLKTLTLENEGHSLKILVINPNRSRAIIYFGGNAEAVIFNEQPFRENFPEQTVYMVNYRGYGGSSGTPTEAGLYSDALAVYDRIQTQHELISLVGRSLGSGVAVFLAAKRPVESIVLVTPYDSIRNVAQERFRIYPVSWLILDKYDSISRAGGISARVLIVMAELDAIIPNSHSVNLQKAFTDEQTSAVKIMGANHNNLSVKPEYYALLKEFLAPNL